MKMKLCQKILVHRLRSRCVKQQVLTCFWMGYIFLLLSYLCLRIWKKGHLTVYKFQIYFLNSFMKKRNKLQMVCDTEEVSPAVLMQTVLQQSPEQLTFQNIQYSNLNSRSNIQEQTISSYQVSINQHKSLNRIQSKPNQYCERTFSIAPHNRNRRSTLLHKRSSHLIDQQQISLNRQMTKMKQAVDQKKDHSCKMIFQKNNILQGIVKSQKIKNLQNMFMRKIMRTSSINEPAEFNKFSNEEKHNFLYWKGVQLSPLHQNLLNLLSVVQIITLLVVYSLSLFFVDLINSNTYLSTLQTGSLVFYFVEIIVNCISVKSEAGKKIQVLKDILAYYLAKGFLVDSLSLLILLLDITLSQDVISYFRLFIIFKLPQCFHRIQKLQVYFIRNVYNEQYWELAKVFLVNFCYAHVIALFLAGMAGMNPQDSWMAAKGISQKSWIQQYVWSFYWANNIMLTVGFGDIVANNYQQAICLIFIQTFSCIIMAYNINCVGGIISNIRSQNQQRNKKFKIFKKLTDQNFVTQELAFKINNYIEESSNLRKKFNYQEDQEFVNTLPQTLKITYLREANKQVLKQLVFFKGLLDRTLCNFAEHIQTKIAHPQQIIRAIDDDFNLIILKKGQLGYICKRSGCSFNEQIADLIKVKDGETPFLTSLDFISKQRPLYQIKSLQFSVLFTLDYARFIDIFRQSDMDYELFCFLRDKIRNIPDQFQVLPCEYCKKFNHFKFTCPKLHYAPYEQHCIDKQLYRQKIGRNSRKNFQRMKDNSISPMEYYSKFKSYCSGQSPVIIIKQKKTGCIQQDNSSGLLSPNTKNIQRSRDTITSDLLQSVLDSKTREIIELEFVRQQNRREFVDQVWILNLDVMASYNSYFAHDNPITLGQRFSPQNRNNKKETRVGQYFELDPIIQQSIGQTIKTPTLKSQSLHSIGNYTSFGELTNLVNN